MRQTIFVLTYVLLTIIFLLMANYRIASYREGFIYLNTSYFLIYLAKAIYDLTKNGIRFKESYLLLLASLTFPIVWFKLDFEYYHLYFHLFYTFLLTIFFFFLLKKYNIKKTTIYLIGFSILINISLLCIDDYVVFKFWNSNKVAWSTTKLSWDNYKQTVPENDFNLNVLTTNGLQWKISKVNNNPSIIVIAFMKPSESWAKNDFKTVSQLEHEQLYLDICELHARKIRQLSKSTDLSEINKRFFLTDKQIKNNSTLVITLSTSKEEKLIQAVLQQKNDMNSIYMIETANGQNTEKQKKWENLIKTELKKLEAYKK